MSKGASDSSTNILRGGQLRKTARGIVSFAPFLASVSVVALGAMLAGSSPAVAQTMSTAKCTSENSDGAYVCSGIQNSDADAPETITAVSGQTLAVTQDSEFGLFVDDSAHNGETAMTITAEPGSSGGQVDFFTRIANTTRGGGDALKIVNNSGSDITFNNLLSDSHGGAASEYILSALADAVVLEGTGAGDIIFNTDGQISTTQAQSYGTGLGGKGVEASHSGSGDLAITTGRIKTESGGINVVHSSGATGAITITANGDITAGFNYRTAQQESANMPVLTDSSVDDDNSNGIEVATATTTQGAVSITANGGITSSADGIRINHYGGGAVSITANSITATDIDADDCGVPGACRNIGNDGIHAITRHEEGESATFTEATFTIDVKGDIDASNDAIRLSHRSGPRNVEITTAVSTTLTTTGDTARDGISVGTGTGSGSLTITANGAIGTSSNRVGGDGIFGFHYGDGTVEITANDIFAEKEGIDFYQYGEGTATITVNGNIDAGNNAGNNAVAIYQPGSGALTITTNGTISSDHGDGIEVNSSSASVTIVANGAIGTSSNSVGRDGIEAEHYGSGTMMITTNDIFAARYGIKAYGASDSGIITINARGNINSGSNRHGITAYQKGSGDLTIITTADKTITAGADGIAASTYEQSSANITINAHGNIMAQTEGIDVDHSGAGAVAITTGGTITSAAEEGIYVSTASDTADSVDITANGNIMSEKGGIEVDHEGTGAVTITTHGTITSSSYQGISVTTEAATAGAVDITITENIQSEEEGIYISQGGAGAVTVATTGAITTNNDDGISIRTSVQTTGTVDITTNGKITADDEGIDVSHLGSGKVTIMVNGTISAYLDGIEVTSSQGATGAVEIVAREKITASYHGVYVFQSGTGSTNVTTAAVASTSAGYDGVRVESETTASGDMEILTTGTITAEGGGIYVDQNGDGLISIAANGDITVGTHGIYVDQDGAGAVAIVAGAITSENEQGIFVNTASQTTGNVNITANGDIMSEKEGIYLQHNGSGDVDITTNSDVTPSAGEEGIAVVANSASTGDVAIDINGDVVIDSDRTTNSAVFVNNGSGTTRVNVSKGTVASDSGTAIEVLGAADAIVTLNDGASLGANFNASANSFTGTATLALAGSDTSGSNNFELVQAFSVDNLEKNGTGTWTLTGAQGQGESFTNFDVNEGRVIWGTTSTLQAISATIADGATLEITQANTQWSVASTLSGRLALTGASSSAIFGAVTASNGNIDIDVDFSGGSVTLTTARFSATSVDGTIPVNIRAMGGSAPSQQVTISNLIAVADSDAFTAGIPLNGGFNFDLQYDTANTRWDVVATPAATGGGDGGGSDGNGGGNNGGGGGSGGNNGGNRNGGIRESIGSAFFEMLPMALAQLSWIESLHERVQSKRFQGADDIGTWARVKGGTVEMNPGISTYSTGFRTQNTDLEFGADVPLGPVNIGASVAFGSVESEIFHDGATGNILTNTIAASLSATWKYQGFYADAQGRYVDFSNDMEADGEGTVEDMSANSISAGLELGYGIDVSGLQVTSSAQTWWSGINFDDFTDTGGATIALEDGEVMFGRVGVLLEREVEHIVWHGYGNVITPLDGEMAVDVDGVKMPSESREAVFDAGVGMAYDWDDGAYVGLLGISTQQGKEIEGYSASVELKVVF